MGEKLLLVLTLLIVAVGMFSPVLAEQNEDATVGVSVDRVCEIEQNQLEPPGTESITVNDTTYNINAIGVNETDDFFFDFYNTGNRNATVTVNLTVTNETDYWTPGNPKGNFINLTKQKEEVNESYEPFTVQTTYYIPSGENAITNTYYLITKLFAAEYPPGFYTGRLNINYTCPNNDTREITNYANFLLVEAEVLTAGGEGNVTGGTEGDIPSDTPFPSRANFTSNLSTDTVVPRNANRTGNFTANTTAPEGISNEGNYSTNQTAYKDVNQTGLEANQTIPADANRTGETSNQTIQQEANRTGGEGQKVPGDNPEPGVTPDPTPKPRLVIDIEPFKDEYVAKQGQFTPVDLQIQNVGDTAVNDFQVTPQIDQLRQGWQVRNAQISSIPAGGNISREVFVRPPQSASPGLYVSPVVAGNGSARYDLDYFSVRVKKSDFASQLSIQESPSSLALDTNSSSTLPVLIQNNGEKPLTDVTARLQNAESCAATSSSTVNRVGVGESASLNVELETSTESETCESTLIVSSSEGSYAFGDVEITTRPEGGLIPREQRVPFLAIAWTLVLAAYAVVKKRYELDSGLVKAPFIMLLMGEATIILYLIVNYYGLMSVAFLPF